MLSDPTQGLLEAPGAVDPDYVAAFFNKFHRNPTSERDFKILPTVYFIEQAKLKKQRRFQTQKSAVVIQAWFRRILKQNRPERHVETQKAIVIQSWFRRILKKSRPTTKVVRFALAENEGKQRTIDKLRVTLERRKFRLKKELAVFSRNFIQANGREPVDWDWLPVLPMRKRYAEVKKALERVAQKQQESKRIFDLQQLKQGDDLYLHPKKEFPMLRESTQSNNNLQELKQRDHPLLPKTARPKRQAWAANTIKHFKSTQSNSSLQQLKQGGDLCPKTAFLKQKDCPTKIEVPSWARTTRYQFPKAPAEESCTSTTMTFGNDTEDNITPPTANGYCNNETLLSPYSRLWTYSNISHEGAPKTPRVR